MSRLKQILELYEPKGEDEKRFMHKHTDNVLVHADPAGNKDEVFKASNVKQSERKSERHGYEAGEDEDVYEEFEDLSIDDFENLIDDIVDQLDEEELDIIDNMTEEELDEFLSNLVISEKKCDDDDDDEDDDDDDDDEDDDELDESQAIDELSKSTLGSYIKKAHADSVRTAGGGHPATQDDDSIMRAQKQGKRMGKRRRGIQRAVNALATGRPKVDELSHKR